MKKNYRFTNKINRSTKKMYGSMKKKSKYIYEKKMYRSTKIP